MYKERREERRREWLSSHQRCLDSTCRRESETERGEEKEGVERRSEQRGGARHEVGSGAKSEAQQQTEAQRSAARR